jgi:hypothetical protein
MADFGTLAPWCVQEQWEVGITAGGKAFALVTGRTNAPTSLKRNPLWWKEQLRAASRPLVSSRLAALASATLLELLPQSAAKRPRLRVGLG